MNSNYSIFEQDGKFFARIGDDRAAHGPFKTREAADEQASSLAGCSKANLHAALFAYAKEFDGQDGAMDPDHGSAIAQRLCAALGTAEWHAEFGVVSMTEGTVDIIFNGDRPTISVRTDVRTIEESK